MFFTISVSKKNQVIEPSKYHALKGEKILKYKKGKKYYYKHLDKHNNLIADLGYSKLSEDLKFKKNLNHSSFKKNFLELENESKKKTFSFYKKKFKDDINYLKNIYPNPPIIIVGCGRSGTTLLLSILSSHKKIHGIKDESYCFTPNFLRLKNIYNFLTNKKSKKLCWLEKTPKNILNIEKIYKLFDGKVKIIHIIRNPKDVIHSKHPNSNKQFYIPLSRWKKEVGYAKKFEKFTLTVRFEDILSNFNYEIKRILNYVNLSYDKRINYFTKYTTVKNNPAWGKNYVKKINKIKRKRTYNNKLIKTLYADKYAQKLMKYYNYK